MSRARSKFSGPRKKERKAWNGYLAIFPLGVMRGFESLVITSRQWPLSPMKDVISVVILQIRHVRFLLLNEMNSLLGERLLQRIPLIRNLLSPLLFLHRYTSNFQNPSRSKFQTFLSPLHSLSSNRSIAKFFESPPLNSIFSINLSSSFPPLSYIFFSSLSCLHLHLASQFLCIGRISLTISNQFLEYREEVKRAERIEKNKKEKEEERGGRNRATLERGEGEETVRPGIESVSNGHEHGASRRQASSAD